jgi:uncharacterized protein YidB (DUF937 family)
VDLDRPQPPISPDQLSKILGSDVLGQFAQRAGVAHGDAASILVPVLPGLVDHLTPNAQMPAADDLQGSLGGLLASLSGR